jgi:hypothetical protein
VASSEERHLRVSRGGMADVHEVLAWLVNTYDAQFANANMVSIHADQTMVCGQDPGTGGPDGQWHYEWSGSVAGVVAEKQHPDPPAGFTPVQPPDA